MRVLREAQAEFDFGQAGPGRAPMKPVVGFTVEDDDGMLRVRQFRFSVEREVEHDGDAAEFARPGTVVSLDGFKESFQQHAPKGFGPLDRQVTIDLLLVADDSSARRDEHMAQLYERVGAAETGITRMFLKMWRSRRGRGLHRKGS